MGVKREARVHFGFRDLTHINSAEIMKSGNQIFGLLGVLLVVGTTSVNSFRVRRGMEIEKCRGVNLDSAEDHAMHVNDCLSQSGAKEFHEVPAEKMPCFGKCVMTKKGIIDDKGMPHKENLMKVVTENMPKEVHDDLLKRMETCLAEETSMIDPADATCNTYLPLGMCVHLAFLEECDK